MQKLIKQIEDRILKLETQLNANHLDSFDRYGFTMSIRELNWVLWDLKLLQKNKINYKFENG